MKFPKYCKWCLICLIPVAIFGVPLFIRDGLTWATFIAFAPLLLCPIMMGIVMGKMCEGESCEKEETKKGRSSITGAIERKKMKENIKFIGTVMSKKKYLLISIIFSLLFSSAFMYLSNFDLMRGNLGYVHTMIYISLNMLVVILFGLYLSLFAFRWKEKKALSTKTFGIGVAVTDYAKNH